jgi:hypothetical protein
LAPNVPYAQVYLYLAAIAGSFDSSYVSLIQVSHAGCLEHGDQDDNEKPMLKMIARRQR